MNVCFEYLYRDAGNCKSWGDVVFSNPHDIAITAIIAEAQAALIDGCYFTARQAQVPDLYFKDKREESDHAWHEAFCFTSTTRKPADGETRTIEEFINCLKISRLASSTVG